MRVKITIELLILILSMILSTTTILFIILDVIDWSGHDIKGIEQPKPAIFLSDWTPTSIRICDTAPYSNTKIDESITLFNYLGWPEWPMSIERRIACSSSPSPKGILSIRSCKDLILEDGVLTPPCSPDEEGRVPTGRTRLMIEDNIILSGDIFIHPDSPSEVLWHEMGHARGLISAEGESHSTDSDNLMAPIPGLSLKWLNRDIDGDWPW